MAINTKIKTDEKSETMVEVVKCLETLYGTETGEQILDRDFGISLDIIDQPISVAAARIAQEIIEKTEKYEPRAEIYQVNPVGNANGELTVEVLIGLAQGT